MPSEALAPAPSSTTLKRRLGEETACCLFGKLSGAALLSSGQSRVCKDTHTSGSHQVPSAPPPPAAEMGHTAVTALSRSIFLTWAGVDSSGAKVPGSVPADKDASRVLLRKEFAFLSSFLMLLLASEVGKKIFLNLSDEAEKIRAYLYAFCAIKTMGLWLCFA